MKKLTLIYDGKTGRIVEALLDGEKIDGLISLSVRESPNTVTVAEIAVVIDEVERVICGVKEKVEVNACANGVKCKVDYDNQDNTLIIFSHSGEALGYIKGFEPVVYAKWIHSPSDPVKEGIMMECSRCGYRRKLVIKPPPHCQECGAKMEGGE